MKRSNLDCFCIFALLSDWSAPLQLRAPHPKGDYYVCPMEEGPSSADKSIRMSSIPNSPDVCPIDSDETAEAYIMERLSPADALHFENHCMTCRPCAAAAKEAEWFVRELRVAAQKLVVEPRDRQIGRAHV